MATNSGEMAESTDAGVIVVGAGPTGLMTAMELALAGVRPLVLDARAERNPTSRAGVIHPRTAELLDQRGLLDPLLATGDYPESPIGHFAGLPVHFDAWPGRHPAYNVPQTKLEEFLETQLADRGVGVLRGRRVIDIFPLPEAATVTVDGPDGVMQYRARYVVAADGGRSTIRKCLGVTFPGRPGTATAITAEAVLTGPAATRQGLHRSTEGHWAIQFPLEEPIRRLVIGQGGSSVPRSAEVTEAELRLALRDVYENDIELVRIRRAARIDDSARQITAYRQGAVFFAGDAAHIHLPLAGQGMNLGVGDAVNLGWKLAAALNGWAPEGLLDTYHSERHPVGARVLTNTRTQGLLMDWGSTGHPDLAATRTLLDELLQLPEARRWMAGMMGGLDVRYDTERTTSDPLVGYRVPDNEVVVGGQRQRIHPLLHTGRGLLLEILGMDHHLPDVANWRDRIDYIQAEADQGSPPSAMLIRPDGYVCWTSGQTPLEAALRQWFGTPNTNGTRPINTAEPLAVKQQLGEL